MTYGQGCYAAQRMRLAFRYLAVATAVSSLTVAGFLAACASDDPAAPAEPMEAASDAPLLGDTIAPEPDAEVPLGDICGDSQGIEVNSPWPMRGGCPKRAGASSGPGPQNATLIWSVPLLAGESSPAIGADRIIWVGTSYGDGGGAVVGLSPGGAIEGVLHTAAPVRSSPARSATGLTIIGSGDGTLYGVARFAPIPDGGADAGDPDAGDPDAGDASAGAGDAEAGVGVPEAHAVFKRTLAPISSSPAIGADGTIYIGTTDGKLVALAADGSSSKWTATTNDTLGSSPAIASDGTIYIGSSDRKLYAFTREGSSKWVFETGGAILGSPVVGGDETIYVGSSDGKLYAVAPDGKLRWAYAAGGPITGAPCVRGGVIYVGSDDKKLHAVNTPAGTRRWTYETLGAVATPVVGPDGTVYVGSADGRLYALTTSGLLYFAVNAKGRIRSAPAISDDGTLYITTDNAVVAIGP